MVSLIFPFHYFKFTIFIFFTILLAQGSSIQADEPKRLSKNVPPPAHFVLVHGASLGGWSWYKVRTLLESAGYNVSSPDLKSGGIDPTDAATLYSFQEYNQPLDDILSNLPDGEKVILVGHSYGGFSITDAIINFPEKIHVAVYIAASMVHDIFPFGPELNLTWFCGLLGPHPSYPILSQSPMYVKNIALLKRQLMRMKVVKSAQESIHKHVSNDDIFKTMADTFSIDMKKSVILQELPPLFGVECNKIPPTSCSFTKEFQRNKFFNKSPLEDSTLASMLLKPFPIVAFCKFPMPKKVNDVPRVYIKTMDDQLFIPIMQDIMIAMWPPSETFEVADSDHLAMISQPEQVFDILVKIANKYALSSNNA